MEFKKKYKLTFSAILVSTVFLGCSGASESNQTKTNNANQSTAALNNTVPLPSNTPSVAGVNSPASNNPSNVNKNSKPMPAANMPTPKIGSGGDDMALFTQVRGALGADPELINSVIVEIKEGNASLSGKVPSEEKKKKAEQLVRNINGIKSVKNDLRVAP